jgi:hypothetical protein
VPSDKLDLDGQTLADLKRSGLDKKDFNLMKLKPLTREQTDEFVGEPRASYQIPYFTLDGKVSSYSRVRFLEFNKKAFTKKNGSGKKVRSFRYSQPFNSSPHIYFPPHLDWKKIAKNPEHRILITEGEKKAAAACKMGIACIALGGVYGFTSSKRMQELIPEFAEIKWKDREVEICYDADVMMKSEVRQALSALAFSLSQELNPKSIEFVFLDAETAGSKTGLDDYLVANGKKEFLKLPRQEYRFNARIQLLNQKLCYVEKPARFYDVTNDTFFRNFSHAKEAFMTEGEEVIDGKRTALVVDLWAKSPNRRTVKNVVYVPGEDEITSKNELNTWKPSDHRSRKGKPTKWLELVHFIMREPKYADWFLKWLAYPVQNLGEKLLTAVFVHGAKQGIGKTFVVDPVMEYVYGTQNFFRLSNDDLQDAFNTFAGKNQFVVTNEIYFSEFRDRRAMMSKLKDMITRERVTINEKFQPKMVFQDYCNYYFTSNHPDALVLEPGDRRFFVVEAPDEKLEQSLYDDLDQWLRNENGAGIVRHYLENSVDLRDFNPKGDAMMTPWKQGVISLSKDVLEEFAEQIVEEPELIFKHNGVMPDLKLYRAEDIVKTFEHTHPRYRFNVTANRMARLLNDARLEKRKVRLAGNQPMIVLYALFDRKDWREEKNAAWADHYLREHRKHSKFSAKNKLN